MIQEKIQDYFNKFSALKVLFFFDENEEFLEEVKGLTTPDVKVVYWEHNPFQLKYQLTQELKDQKVFLYLAIPQPTSQEAYHKFPLMGLLLANKELRLDDVGTFMEEFGLQRHQKAIVSKYIKELKYVGVQAVCRPVLTSGNFQEKDLQQALISAFLKSKKKENWSVLVARILLLGQESKKEDFKKFSNKVKANQLETLVLDKIAFHTGCSLEELSQQNCIKAGQSVLYNVMTQDIRKQKGDPYVALKIEDTGRLTVINQLWQEIDADASLSTAFKTLLVTLGQSIQGAQLVKCYGSNASFGYYTNDLVWEVIIQLQDNLQSDALNSLKAIENLDLQQEIIETQKQCIRFLRQVVKTFVAIDAIETYTLNSAEDYIQTYSNSWYKIDTNYRRSISCLNDLDRAEVNSHLDIEAIQLQLNECYEKHTDQLNRDWLRCAHEIEFDYNKIQVPKQYNFYDTEVAPIDQKVVVVISDALRYEAGIELLSKMHGDTKNTAEIRHMLASIPSKTNVGMAQLLPGEKTFNNGKILSDQISTESTYRTKVLQTYKPNAQAVQYENVIAASRNEIRELFKNDLVYVYHDVIDSTGDARKSERRTFDAVIDAVAELEKFIKLLHSSYNVANVLITADHGFLYTDKKIVDKDLEKIEIDSLISHNRYFVTEKPYEKELGYTIPLRNTTAFNDDLYVTVPFSVNRYRKAGVGHQFVHGGASLQELLVPLIVSSRKRVEFAKKVNPLLLNKGKLRVVSNILKFNILQENEVSRMEKERSISIALYKESQVASNVVELSLNSTSESPGDRLTNIELITNSEAENEGVLKLKIFDIEDMLNPLIEELVQNNTLIQADF